MSPRYKYRQTLVLLKNKYPENLFFLKKKIKKYNYLFEENNWIIEKTKKNLLLCSFKQYRQIVDQKVEIGKKKVDLNFLEKGAKGFVGKTKILMNNFLDSLLYKQPAITTERAVSVDKKFIVLYTATHLYSKLLFHGSGYKRVSYFFEKIRERKKLKILYGYYNRKYLQKQYKSSTKCNYSYQVSTISMFEFNINFFLCRCGYTPHVQKAEQMIKHRHYLLNNKNIFSTHMKIKRGDVISIKNNNRPAKKTLVADRSCYVNPKDRGEKALAGEYPSKAGGIENVVSPLPKLANINHPISPTQWIRFGGGGVKPNLFYKRLSIQQNKLKYRYLCSEILLNGYKTFYILQKFNRGDLLNYK